MVDQCAHCRSGVMPVEVRHVSHARGSVHHHTCFDRRGDYVLRLESENARLRDLLERYDGTDASAEWKRDVREMIQ